MEGMFVVVVFLRVPERLISIFSALLLKREVLFKILSLLEVYL
jgi:hypothetical protein